MLAVRELRDRGIISSASSANRIFCIYAMHNFWFAPTSRSWRLDCDVWAFGRNVRVT